MNKAILSGELVGHIGSTTTESNMEVHQATLRTFEPFLDGQGHEEFHALVFFGEDARRVRELPLGARLLIQASIRWAPAQCLHVHGLEVL